MPDPNAKGNQAPEPKGVEGDQGVPVENRLAELKRKNKKLEDEITAGRAELTSMRQFMDSFKKDFDELKSAKAAPKQEPPVDSKDMDAMFWAQPHEMTKRVLSETLANEFLPKFREIVKAEVSGVESKLTSKEQTSIYNNKAVSEFPALTDAESEFYQETEKALLELSLKPSLKDDPELVYLAAQRAAARRPDLAKKAKDEYSYPAGGSQFEMGGVSPRRRVNKNVGPSAEDKALAAEFNEMMADTGVKITPESIEQHRAAALRMNPKLALYMKRGD